MKTGNFLLLKMYVNERIYFILNNEFKALTTIITHQDYKIVFADETSIIHNILYNIYLHDID